MISVDKLICNGCQICKKKCPFGAISISSKYPEFNDACMLCGICEKACPKYAITIDIQSGLSSDQDQFSDVWVVLEYDSNSNKLRKVSLELLSEARKIADRLNQRVVAVSLNGHIHDEVLNSLSDVGCDELIRFVHKKLSVYNTEIFTSIISSLIGRKKPAIVLFPATEFGRDLAPRVSGRLKVGLTADCTALDIDENSNLIQIRPTYGGNIMASIITPNCRPQMASIRPNVFKIECVSNQKKLDVNDFPIEIGDEAECVEFVEFIKKRVVYKDVSEAEIVISGGYGVGSRENFQLIHELALLTGAAVGASRKAVDEGWVHFDIQVGQTGKTVAPDLYIACGISGALQHSIGIKNARRVIAINSDPSAPIFSQCDVAIVGDVKDILTKLIQMISQQGKQALEGSSLAKKAASCSTI